jgi:hypothetical protein
MEPQALACPGQPGRLFYMLFPFSLSDNENEPGFYHRG